MTTQKIDERVEERARPIIDKLEALEYFEANDEILPPVCKEGYLPKWVRQARAGVYNEIRAFVRVCYRPALGKGHDYMLASRPEECDLDDHAEHIAILEVPNRAEDNPLDCERLREVVRKAARMAWATEELGAVVEAVRPQAG